MAHESGRIVNLTIRVDSGILLLAKHRALLDRTSVNQLLAAALEDYADGAMHAARRSGKAAYVFGVVQEIRELRRREKARRRMERVMIVRSPSAADLTPYQASDRAHEYTAARVHSTTPEGQQDDDGASEDGGR
jgi:hypothetical protein